MDAVAPRRPLTKHTALTLSTRSANSANKACDCRPLRGAGWLVLARSVGSQLARWTDHAPNGGRVYFQPLTTKGEGMTRFSFIVREQPLSSPMTIIFRILCGD